MSLSTLNLPALNTLPRDRVYGRPAQYINITDPEVRTSGTAFIPSSPIGEDPLREDNWTQQDEKDFDRYVKDNKCRLFLLHLHVLSTNITLRTLLQKCVVQQPRNVKTIGMQRALLLPAISYKMVKYIVKPNGMRLLARWSLQSTLQRTLIRLQLLLQHMRTCFTLVGLPHLSPLCLSETTNLLANILVHSPIDQLFYQ